MQLETINTCSSLRKGSLRNAVSLRKLRMLSYDNDAPISVGARHIPSLVLIRCVLFVSGLTHAASRVSSVVNPVRR
jgi:hypothetical protein